MESRSTMLATKGFCEENKNLWKKCQAIACFASWEGEKCLYFPQGHLEQQGFSTKSEFEPKIADLNLPSATLCRTLNIGLLLKENTKDIYLCYEILPETETDPTVPDPYPQDELRRKEITSFFKTLASQTNTGEGSPIPLAQCMPLEVLSTYSHAVSTGTMFTVPYKQSASPFVIPLNKYLEAMNNNIHVGMKFEMIFQSDVEDSSHEKSFFGTVVDIGDFSPNWPDSKWRCLKVHWDEPASIPRPERVSPWEIQPVTSCDAGNYVSDLMALKSKSFKHAHIQSSRIASNSPTSPPEPPIWNESSCLLSKLRKKKASLYDSSSFLYDAEMEKCSASIFASFCNWLCCCFK